MIKAFIKEIELKTDRLNTESQEKEKYTKMWDYEVYREGIAGLVTIEDF